MKKAFTPLSIACAFGNLSVVKLLLQYGASVNYPKYDGRTPLCIANCNGHSTIVALLLSYKAKLDKPLYVDRENETFRYGNSNNNNANNNAAATRNSSWCLADATRNNGLTPLFQAILKGHLATVYILLCNGASVNPTWSYTLTNPIHEASKQNDINIVRILIAYGADIDAKDKKNKTALHLAADHGHTQIVKDLVDMGAVLGGQDENGKTPMDLAMDAGHQSVVTLLKDNSRESLVYLL